MIQKIKKILEKIYNTFIFLLGLYLLLSGLLVRIIFGILPKEGKDFPLEVLLFLVIIFLFSFLFLLISLIRTPSKRWNKFLLRIVKKEKLLIFLKAPEYAFKVFLGIRRPPLWFEKILYKLIFFYTSYGPDSMPHQKFYVFISTFPSLIPPSILLGEFYLWGQVYFFYFSLILSLWVRIFPWLLEILQDYSSYERGKIEDSHRITETKIKVNGEDFRIVRLGEDFSLSSEDKRKILTNYSYLAYFGSHMQETLEKIGKVSKRLSYLRTFLYFLGWLQILLSHPSWENIFL